MLGDLPSLISVYCQPEEALNTHTSETYQVGKLPCLIIVFAGHTCIYLILSPQRSNLLRMPKILDSLEMGIIVLKFLIKWSESREMSPTVINVMH